VGSYEASGKHDDYDDPHTVVQRISNSYASGNVTGSGVTDVVGGLIGVFNAADATISNSYASGANTSTNLGAVVGTLTAGSFVDIYWDSDKTAGSAVSGTTGATTSDMKTFGTFSDAGWLIVAGWSEFDTNVSIWGVCTNLNGGYPFLLFQFTEAEASNAACPIVSVGTSGSSSSGADTGVPGIYLAVAGPIGRAVGHSPVYYGADRVAASSEYQLRVFSSQTTAPVNLTLGNGTLAQNGSFAAMVRLPDLAPGTYFVQLSGKHTSGKTLELTAQIVVEPNGAFSAIGPNIPMIR
jgi:hypothetical protein